MARVFLVLAGCLVLAALAAASAPPGWQEAGFGRAALFQVPTEERELLVLNLSGTATHGQRALAASLDVQGVVTRTLPDGPGQSERGTLAGVLRLADAQAEEVRGFPVQVQYHAERADYLTAGTAGWKLRLDAPDAERAFALLGSTTGFEVQAGQAAWLVQMYGPLDPQLELTFSGVATETRQ